MHTGYICNYSIALWVSGKRRIVAFQKYAFHLQIAKPTEVEFLFDLVEVTGWAGALMILTGFAINVFKFVESDTILFLILNLCGSALLTVNSFITENYHFTLLNSVWFAVTIVGLLKTITSDKTSR